MAGGKATPQTEPAPELARYSRQMLFEPLGDEGQHRLLASRVALIGCGGLGTVLANTLVRAGVGFLRIVDRPRPPAGSSSASTPTSRWRPW